MKHKFERYCDDFENIENYELAKADNFKGWDCHHRLELIATGGVCDVTVQDLIDWGIYYHRPADELIFLRTKEHSSLHSKGKKFGPLSEETRNKISEATKGRPTWNKGFPHSEETRRKMSEAAKGERNPMYGKHWMLVGNKRVYY